MNEEFAKINGKVQKCKTFTFDEIKGLFNDNDWNRTFKDPSFLNKVGLSAPPETFLVAGSVALTPPKERVVAGICTLRIDEKDRPKGFPINWNHWDFLLDEENKNKVIMVPSNQKRRDHWFKTEEEWQERIKRNPPHEDKIGKESQNA